MTVHLLYGGTFDPIHEGHLTIARAARDALATTVHLMPAGDPPHRAPPRANAQHRSRMVELAAVREHGIAVDHRELRRASPSYSIDTLREVRAELGPQAPIALLVGADSFRGLATWKEWRSLFGLAHFVVAERSDAPLDALTDELAAAVDGRWAGAEALARAPAGLLHRLRHPLHPASASEIRRRIAAGEPWREWVPEAVAAYIDRHMLYAKPWADSPPL